MKAELDRFAGRLLLDQVSLGLQRRWRTILPAGLVRVSHAALRDDGVGLGLKRLLDIGGRSEPADVPAFIRSTTWAAIRPMIEEKEVDRASGAWLCAYSGPIRPTHAVPEKPMAAFQRLTQFRRLSAKEEDTR